MRQVLLPWLYKAFPFELRGDCKEFTPKEDLLKISCVINFYGRLDLLSGILHSLAAQDFPREEFEVVLVEDQGGTDDGRAMCESFSDCLTIVYKPLDKNFGKMGYSRNFGLSQTRGGIVLFLDDDTILLQKHFLSKVHVEFEGAQYLDALVPRGYASFALVEDRYDFHDPFFMTSRCMAYRRNVLEELEGFMSSFVGQEDVEFVIRFNMAGKRSENCSALEYYHPPLLVPNANKAMAVGASFYQLKERYPFFLWLLVLFNCSRHAPLMFSPMRRHREMGRFGWGFLKGVWACLIGKKEFKYS